MNAMLLNLGLAPIPPTPAQDKPTKPKPVKVKFNSSRGPGNAGLIAMHARNLARREGDLLSAMDYIKREKVMTVKALAWRFGWTHCKAEDIMQVLKKRGKVVKLASNKAGIWGPTCQ